MYNMSTPEFRRRRLENDGICHLFCIMSEADSYNEFQISNSQKNGYMIAKPQQKIVKNIECFQQNNQTVQLVVLDMCVWILK